MGGNKQNMPQSKLQGESQSEALVLASILVENQRRKKNLSKPCHLLAFKMIDPRSIQMKFVFLSAHPAWAWFWETRLDPRPLLHHSQPRLLQAPVVAPLLFYEQIL